MTSSSRASAESASAAVLQLLEDGSPVSSLAHAFAKRGHELYLVGGPVRDAWLGRAHRDLDFSTDALPEVTQEVIAPFVANVWLQGVRWGTVGAEVAGTHVEITTFRIEKYQPASRHPEVSFESDVVTDLSRRDFTVNAMAIKLPGNEMVDPFGGLADLKSGLLKTPLDPKLSFTDDPLRMLRAFRFASQLGFRIDQSAVDAISELKDHLVTVSAERIRDELSGLLLGQAPMTALALAERSGLTALFLPELSALKLQQDPIHRHKDVFSHTLAVLERTDSKDLTLRLAALLHDIGKPRTRKIDPEGVTFHHHEVVGASMAKARLQALRYPNEIVADVSELIRLHHRFHTYSQGWSDSAVRRYVRDAGPLLGKLNALVRADCTTRNASKANRLAARMDQLEARVASLAEREELERIRPDLDGRQVMAYLGVPPGPTVGEALEWLLEVRLEEGLLEAGEAFTRLDEWARARRLEPAGEELPRVEKKKT
ncbi:MAG: CCA tRNA nucleotidyltransferase [Actinobacteria bacterium]|nr:CCA tRNA nucleotidyltransferase [Actinomycetota bacterium]